MSETSNTQQQERDPNGKHAHEAGAKLDAGKNRLGLVLGGFSRALQEVGRVGTFGAAKYTDEGWGTVPDAPRRYTDAMYRHLLAEAQGEVLDPETQLHHAAHAAWNALARLDLLLRNESTEKPGTSKQNPLRGWTWEGAAVAHDPALASCTGAAVTGSNAPKEEAEKAVWRIRVVFIGNVEFWLSPFHGKVTPYKDEAATWSTREEAQAVIYSAPLAVRFGVRYLLDREEPPAPPQWRVRLDGVNCWLADTPAGIATIPEAAKTWPSYVAALRAMRRVYLPARQRGDILGPCQIERAT